MKKSIVISLLTIVTLFCTAICSLASTGKVTTDTLRVRKEPSTDSSTIALLSIGDEIEILEEENGWYKIQSGENVGYVAAQYINVLTNTKVNTDQNIQNVNEDNKENENTNQDGNNEENSQNENTENQEQTSGETVTVLGAGEKIYITPLINSLVLSKLEEEKQIEVVSEINGWSYIKQSTTSGWVRTESIQRKVVENNTSNNEENNNENNNNNNSSQTVGYISANSVNFRKSPNTSGEVIRKLSKNDQVTVKTKGDTWAEIEYDGDTGYVSVDYISDKEIGTTSRSAETRTANNKEEVQNTQKATSETKASEPVSTGNGTGADVVAYAKQYLGSKYVSGGASPKGFDCSGFTTYVFKHFGVSLNRTSSGQASNGTFVGKADLIAGDIICFSSSSSSKKIGHVGIYIGGGKFIHSANSRKGVIISNVTGDGYYYVTARRVI